MDFSKAQFEALISEITTGMQEFSGNLDKMVPVASAAVNQWYITDDIADAVMWIARKTVEVGKELLAVFIDMLKGAIAPVYMFYDASQWMDVRGSANGVAASLSEQNLAIDDSDWSGSARDAYAKALAAQSGAATRVGSIASSTSMNLLAAAAAGTAFYVTLAAVLAKLIAASVTALVALGSAVFSWAGAALILEEAGVNTAIIATAVATLTAFLAAQTTTLISLHGDAVDPTNFPGGAWPKSNTGQYNDGTVTDGDADWSLATKG
jgi:hypothetical protein